MFYKHFKGKFYLKLLTVRDCDDCTKKYVVYISLYKNDFRFGQAWIRSELIFNDVHPLHRVKRMRMLTFIEAIMLLTGLKNHIK